MNWYLTKLVFRIICGDGCHTPQYEEQLRLIAAHDRPAALKKAVQIGKQEEESFFNPKQQLVSWRFVNITEIYPLTKMIDGAEVFSRITEEESAELYEYVVNRKSQNIIGQELPACQDPN